MKTSGGWGAGEEWAKNPGVKWKTDAKDSWQWGLKKVRVGLQSAKW
jgi:hypothetical protein